MGIPCSSCQTKHKNQKKSKTTKMKNNRSAKTKLSDLFAARDMLELIMIG